MRVAQLIGSLLAPLGGAEQYCVELSRALRDRGHEVTIVTGWASAEIVDALHAQGIEVRVVPVRRPYPPDRKGSRPAAALFHALDLVDSIRTPRALRRVMAEPWDVVHAHRVAGLGAHVLRSTPAPVVVTVHDYSLVDTTTTLLRNGVEAERPPLVQRLRTRVLSRAVREARLVFPSEQLRAKHAAWGLEVPTDAVVIPHGWRVTGAAAALPAAGALSTDAVLSTDTDAPVSFLFLGKLLEAKGVRLLLEAWGAGVAGAELRIAGAGPLAAEVRAAAAAAPTAGIEVLGWLDDDGRRAALARASALVLPSTWPEIFLLSAAEGVIAGRPVVSTTVASPPVVVDGVNGLLVDATAPALRAALERLVRDAGLRARLVSGARATASDLDFDRHAARLDALYAEVAGRVPAEVGA